jgi:hypothetical protein
MHLPGRKGYDALSFLSSKYNLQYDSGSDRLKGTYFQAVERQTFENQKVQPDLIDKDSPGREFLPYSLCFLATENLSI